MVCRAFVVGVWGSELKVELLVESCFVKGFP